MTEKDAFSSWAIKQVEKTIAPAAPFPKGRAARIQGEDEEVVSNDDENTFDAGVWFIGYRDSKGNESERRVSVKGIAPKNGIMFLNGWCHEREQFRSFRVDRIVEAHDCVTGQIFIQSDDILPAFTEFMREMSKDPEKNASRALKDCSAVLNILMYLSRCDGQSHPAEIEIAMQYIGDKWFEFELDDKVLHRHVQRLYPTKPDFISAIESTYRFKDEDFRKRVRRYAALMIEADGVVLPVEYSAAAIIDEVKAEREEQKRLKEQQREEEFWDSLNNNPYVFKFSATK